MSIANCISSLKGLKGHTKAGMSKLILPAQLFLIGAGLLVKLSVKGN